MAKGQEQRVDFSALRKVPPHNLEAEQSLLGSMLISPEVVPMVAEVVRAEDFYREGHRQIFDAMMGLYADGEPSDPI
ncbi:MAG: DnaB-like helicase N-terminal domain-containing protein, partial [Terriglobia bacterium]